MNERIKELSELADQMADDKIQMQGEYHPDWHDVRDQFFTQLIVKDCIVACDEVAEEADAMTKSKFVTDAGRMLHEGMWGGAQNCKAGILNRFGVE